MKINLSDIEKEFKNYGYIVDENTIYAVYTALMLEKPLLIDGPAGTGKTEIAKVLSNIFNAKLIRLQCYEGIDFSKVLYEVDYAKKLFRQVLFQGIGGSKIDALLKGNKFTDVVEQLENEMGINGEEFIIERPVYEAINPNNKETKVLLIDEIDKADSEVENMLLETLSDFSISIPEVGTIECDKKNKPIVVLTSNAERELSEALRRRCVYLRLDYPSVNTEMEILKSKANVSDEFAKSVAELIFNIRKKVKLRQKPSIAESIEWANTLFNFLGVKEVNSLFLNEIKNSLCVLSKNHKDIEKISVFLEEELS